MNREIKSLPMVALRGMTIMPEMVVHFDVSREKSIAAIQEAMGEFSLSIAPRLKQATPLPVLS